MKLYQNYYCANYFWIIRVENGGNFKIGTWEAISAAMSTSVSIFLMIFSTLSLISELGIVEEVLGFDKFLYMVFPLGILGLNVWYFLGRERYAEIANANKFRFDNRVWIISYTFTPLIVSLGILLGLSLYVG